MNLPQQNAAMTNQTTTSWWNRMSKNSPQKHISRADSHLVEGMRSFNDFKDVSLNVEQVATLLYQYRLLCGRRERLKAAAIEQKRKVVSYSTALRAETAYFEAECNQWNAAAQQTTADLLATFMLEQLPEHVRAKQAATQDQADEAKTGQPGDGPNPFADNISVLSISTISSDQPLLPHQHHGFADLQDGGMSDYDREDYESHTSGGRGPFPSTPRVRRDQWAA